MTAEVAVRPMHWWDIPAVALLEAAAFPATAWSVEVFWSELAHVPESRWYGVAVSGGDLVGYAGLMTVDPQGDVQTIAVAEDARGQGVGSRLLDALLDEAARRGCTQVMLEVAADNEAARSLYAAKGFEPLARRSGYYGPGQDAVVMRRPMGGST